MIANGYSRELDAQVGDAGAGALAPLELREEGPGVGLQRAQLVELAAVAVRDHASVAHHRSRVLHDRAAEEGKAVLRHLQVVEHLCEERRASRHGGPELGQERQAVAQRRKVAGPRVFQRDAARDALDVGETAQQLVNCRVHLGERRHGFVARG